MSRIAHAGDLAAAQHGAGLHSSRISCSLWLMYRMLQPSDASFFSTTNSFSTACGVSTEVGSSRISSLRDWSAARG
jgi:hypothetical protein